MVNDRKERRYSTYLMNPERAFVDIDAGIKIRGRIYDLSAGGLSFEVQGSDLEFQAVERAKDYFIEIVIDSLRIVSGVRRAWSVIRNGDSGPVYISGVRFEIMSSDDRLKLYRVIESIRSASTAGS